MFALLFMLADLGSGNAYILPERVHIGLARVARR